MKPGSDYVGVGIGAAILNDEGKLFLSLRSQNTRNEKGLWETPGGGLEFGETMEQTVIREMKEEYGIEIEPIKILHVYDHILKGEKQHWVAITFICKIKSGTPTIMEPHKCDGIGWFSYKEAMKLPLTHTAKMDIKELMNLKLLQSSAK